MQKKTTTYSDAIPTPAIPDARLTVTQAAKRFGLPRSRIAKAARLGYFCTEKVEGKYRFTEEAIKEAMRFARSSDRVERTFTTVETQNLCVVDRKVEWFATNAAANEFAALLAQGRAT